MSNPYASPTADGTSVTQPNEFPLHDPVARPISHGWIWIAQGFNLFKQDWTNWLVICVVGFIIIVATGLIPIANLINFFLTYVWMGGLFLGCKALHDGQKISIAYLFAGFKREYLLPLVLLSLLMFVLYFVVIAAAFGTVAANLFMNAGDPDAFMSHLMQNPMEFLLAFTITLALFVPIMMAGWFAPLLMVLHKVPLLQALKMSFLGCLKNVLPFLLYGLVLFVLLLIGALPLLLGLLVVVPLIYCSMFCAYLDIFVE